MAVNVMLIDMSRLLTLSLLSSLLACLSLAQEPQAPEKKGSMVLDLKKFLPPPEPKVEAPPKPAPEKKIVEEETPQQRFRRIKTQAEAGVTQSQYELGLYYAQTFERLIPLDYFEAIAWLQKAADKNHRLAHLHLYRFNESGRGLQDKNPAEAAKHLNASALLGCKQSQRLMTQFHLNAFHRRKTTEAVTEKEEAHLIEAYAWACVTAENTLASRDALLSPTAEEISVGHALTQRDYGFERASMGAAEQDRDGVAKNPSFSKKLSDDAKLRVVTLSKEVREYQKANKPK